MEGLAHTVLRLVGLGLQEAELGRQWAEGDGIIMGRFASTLCLSAKEFRRKECEQWPLCPDSVPSVRNTYFVMKLYCNQQENFITKEERVICYR
jgi:hypothetical protein